MTAADPESECVTLALQGEALCRSGDFPNGIEVFLQALNIGTSNVAVLSAIYIQLGNAYFYLENYDCALEFHKRDLRIARDLRDERGEAKASGNIATTLKCLGQYEEAIVAGQRQLDIYRKLGDDKLAIARALYNLGNVYLAKGKSGIIAGMIDGEELCVETREDLMMAAAFYKENYGIVKEAGDLPAQGRVCGNLGSVEYMMSNFPVAVMHHQERLLLARECKDVPAERRAYTNLGNCHVFLGQYTVAEQYYLKALALVDAQRDRALEAQACYSLGNTYSLMDKHPEAVQYYRRHLAIANELEDAVGQSRAYWSLGSAYAALGNTPEAIRCAEEHLRISQDIGDSVGCSFAEASLEEYTKSSQGAAAAPEDVAARIRRISMEQMDLLRLTPDAKSLQQKKHLIPLPEEKPGPSSSRPVSAVDISDNRGTSSQADETEDFFDMLSRVQSKRYDDQRATFAGGKENNQQEAPQAVRNGRNNNHHNLTGNGHSRTGIAHGQVRTFEELMDMIAGVQSKRIDEQRADLPPSAEPAAVANGRRLSERKPESIEDDSFPDEQFFDMLVKVQGSRMVDQRATLSSVHLNKSAPTVPEEDFSTLVIARRLGSFSGPSSSASNSNPK